MPDVSGKKLPDPDDLPINDEPVVAWATVVKDKTDDGMHLTDPKFVGARLAINLRTTRYQPFYNTVEKKYHSREVVDALPPLNGWIPVEILKVDL